MRTRPLERALAFAHRVDGVIEYAELRDRREWTREQFDAARALGHPQGRHNSHGACNGSRGEIEVDLHR